MASDSESKINKTLTPFKRIAILGGTFDPIHLGHLKPAQQVAKWLDVEQLTLLPAHIPPHKNGTYANAKQRQAMVDLVCQYNPLFKIDARELARSTPSYTVETLRELKRDNPQCQLFFIIGMDSLLNFTLWHQWQEILTLCHLVVNSRPHYDISTINNETKELLKQRQTNNLSDIEQAQSGRIFIQENLLCDISSTEIRAQLKNLSTDNNYLPEYIFNYINQQQLYR